MHLKFFFLLPLLFATNVGISKPNASTAILKVLKNQVSAWNEGSIERYMKGYWNNDSLLFIGKNGPAYGYQNTLTRYKKSYADTASMGKLGFEVLSLKKLSPNYYFAVGKWNLKRSIGNLSGSWTLLFKRINREWKIVADHSS